MKVVVGVGSQETEGAVRERNDANLPAPISSFRRGGGDEQTGHFWKPNGLVIEAILGDGSLLGVASGNVHGEEPADILRGGLDDGNHNGLAIRGPGKGQIIDMKLLMMEKIAFESAVAPGDLEVSDFGIAMLVQVSEAQAIGRKRNGSVDIFYEQARRSAEHGSVIEGSDGLLGVVAADAVNVIAIGGESETTVAGGGGRDDLRVASRGSVPKPEGLQTILIKDVEQVFPVRGNSGEEDVTVVGEILDRHLFDGQNRFVWQERIDAERGGDEQEDNCPQQEARAELVLARCGDEDGTARGRARRLGGSNGRRGRLGENAR